MKFPSPHPGIINFFDFMSVKNISVIKFPSPHPGIINFFLRLSTSLNPLLSFRPLIRGLSISSHRHHYIFSTKTDKFAICKPRAPPEFSKKFHLPAAANCLILRAKTTKHGLLA